MLVGARAMGISGWVEWSNSNSNHYATDTHTYTHSVHSTMIRRSPTAITVTASDVAELKAQREAARMAKEAGGQGDKHGLRDEMTMGQGTEEISVARTAAAEHPADRAARERRERSAADRIGL